MKCEHFLYYMENSYGYRLLKSPNLHTFLSDDSLHHLVQLDGPKNTRTQTLLEERYVAVTYFGQTYDEYSRSSKWQHTIFVFVGDYFTLDCPLKRLEPHFIKESQKPPNKLEAIQIEVKT